MLVWQAHMALAQSLGDPITPTGSPVVIPNGVRYSKALRDSYLYRAMLKVLANIVKQTAALPKSTQDEVLSRILPTYRREYSDFKPLLPNYDYELDEQIVHMYSVVVHGLLGTDTRPVVYTQKSSHGVATATSDLHGMIADPMYTLKMNATMDKAIVSLYTDADTWERVLPNLLLHTTTCSYIPVPKNPANQASEDMLDFEPTLYESVLTTALLLGRIDSQDFTDIQALAPLIAGGQ